MKKNGLKKSDILLFVCIFAASLAAYFIMGRYATGNGGYLEIYADNALYGRYSLEENREIDINGHNKCVIKDGKACMEEADCPDRICVHSGSISESGESIICIPNRVTLLISGEGEKYDTVVK